MDQESAEIWTAQPNAQAGRPKFDRLLASCRSAAFAGTLNRDAKITEIYEGTSEIQRLVITRAETGLH